MNPFDAKGWADHFQAMRESNRLRDELRPSSEVLGNSLITCWLVIARTIGRRTAPLPPPGLGFEPANISYRRVGPEALDRKQTATRHLNRRNKLLREVLSPLVAVALDDMYTLGMLMVTNAPLRPTLAMARVMLDAAIQVGYLCAEGIDPADRSARAANFRIGVLDEERQDRDPDNLTRDALLSQRNHLLKLGQMDGLATKKTRWGLAFDPWPNAREMALALGGDPTHDIFRVLSSAAHGQERSVLGLVTGSLAGGSEANMRARAAYFVGPAVAVAQAALFLACQYAGADTELISPTILQAQQVWRLGSWGYPDLEDAIRANEVGGP